MRFAGVQRADPAETPSEVIAETNRPGSLRHRWVISRTIARTRGRDVVLDVRPRGRVFGVRHEHPRDHDRQFGRWGRARSARRAIAERIRHRRERRGAANPQLAVRSRRRPARSIAPRARPGSAPTRRLRTRGAAPRFAGGPDGIDARSRLTLADQVGEAPAAPRPAVVATRRPPTRARAPRSTAGIAHRVAVESIRLGAQPRATPVVPQFQEMTGRAPGGGSIGDDHQRARDRPHADRIASCCRGCAAPVRPPEGVPEIRSPSGSARPASSGASAGAS